jgi:glucose-6-phosphate dehydrogenase assembly protein OpcA
MEGAVTSRLTRSTTPDAIEPDLAALWREVARQGRVARAVMSNLVIVRGGNDEHTRGADAAMAGHALVDEVAARHPCRLIILNHRPDPSNVNRPFTVTIGIVTFGKEPARYAIEQIDVQSACAEACLPSIVRQLVRGDVPTSVWWMDDLSQVPPLDGIVGMGRQFLYDSRGWRDARSGLWAVAALLRSRPSLDLADLNWRRLAPVRQALLHGCTSAGFEALGRGRVRIMHRPGDAALAWLAVGWLASRLEWTRDTVPDVEEALRADAVLAIEVGGTTATLDSHQVLVSTEGIAPLSVAVPRESAADIVVAELRDLSHDICLHDAVEAAALFLQ